MTLTVHHYRKLKVIVWQYHANQPDSMVLSFNTDTKQFVITHSNGTVGYPNRNYALMILQDWTMAGRPSQHEKV